MTLCLLKGIGVNWKRIVIIFVVALVASAGILWYELPIGYPWLIFKYFMLFLELFAVFTAAILACVFVGGKKSS